MMNKNKNKILKITSSPKFLTVFLNLKSGQYGAEIQYYLVPYTVTYSTLNKLLHEYEKLKLITRKKKGKQLIRRLILTEKGEKIQKSLIEIATGLGNEK